MRNRNKYYKGRVHTAELPLVDNKRETIIKWLYDSNLVPWYSTYILQRSLNDDLVQDLIGEIYLKICEVKQSKWDYLYEQGKFAISGYVTGIIRQQLYSDTSEIYYKYYRYIQKEIRKDDDFWNAYGNEH